MAPSVSIEATDDTEAFTLPDPLTIEGVAARRFKAGKLIAGVAAPADVALFKGKDQHSHKPLAHKWDHRLNAESAREPSSLKGLARYLSKPGMISLGGGLPSSVYFPFQEFSIKVPSVGAFTEEETAKSGVTLTAGKYDLAEDKSLFDIATAFNYGQSSGAAQLLRWLVEHTELVHNPPYADWSCTMSIGSTSGLDMALRMFLHPNMYLLTEEYTFSSAAETAKAMGVKIAPVEMDTEGMLATSLDSVLSNWDPAARGGSPKPFLVYTVPTGQNPTGATQSFRRRKDLYAVAQKHDLFFIEDEPYYFLQMQPYTGQNAPDVPPPANHAAFLSSLVPSLLSLDTDGRVMRLDSFSKVLAPGSRIGWITAPEQITQRYKNHGDLSTQSPSGFAQLALYKLLDEHFGHAGYLDWLIHIRMEYTKRRDIILAGCEDFLPRDIVSWVPPMAGMFHWMEVQWRKHPLADQLSMAELEQRIWQTVIDEKCLITPGSYFLGDKSMTPDRMFFRATYAAASPENIREAIKRFGIALRKEFELTTNGHVNGNSHT